MSQTYRPSRDAVSRAYGLGGPRARTPMDGATSPDMEDVIRQHAHIVSRVARRIARRTGGAVDMDDLVSAGMLGLIDAHGKYSPDGGRDFATYAEFRIKGSILDELRRMDPMSQPMRRKARAIEKARHALSHELGREPLDTELAVRMGLRVEELERLLDEVQPMTFVGVTEVDFTDLRDELALSRMNRAAMKATLVRAISDLPERIQQVLSLYYFHDLTLREIGEVLEVTEARVCQLHKEAIKRMRAFLEQGDDK
jgi:RNA polymerase sigma factor for flagellar operon FliA